MDDYDVKLMKFIKEHPTCFHAASGQAKVLEALGYLRIEETEKTEFVRGGKYYIMRNDSALIAFRIPVGNATGFRIAASHCDSPRPKLKENPEIDVERKYKKLNVEMYGGAIFSTWFDRPLSAAGRLFVNDGEKIKCVLTNIDRDLLLIPNLAIHMNRDINKGYTYNAQVDMLPLYGGSSAKGILALAAEAADIDEKDVLGSDLYLYNRQEPTVWGADQEFLSAPSIDDLQCAFASLQAFIEAEEGNNIPVHVLFDNEEVGSSTIQGAASTFLYETLERISENTEMDMPGIKSMFASSFMLSADNAHAMHPNHPEKCDVVNRPVLGGGVVLKFSANQKYTTDGYSSAIVRTLAKKAGVFLQVFTNRSDIPGGSTLGNISSEKVPIHTADIGIAQLAMHSAYETCGCGDTAEMVKLMRANFES